MSQFSVELSCPQQRLFRYLADPRHRLEWQSSLVSLEMQSTGDPRIGMRWQECARGLGRFTMEITEHQSHELWAERGSSERGEIDLTLKFSPGKSAETTRVAVTVVMRLRGLLRYGVPMAPLVLHPLLRSDLRRAARLAKDGP